ncbi:hypothetical protein WR25_19870 [Diploscapter pachys]|uniref:rRNA methyltransferase n=1 Tax=Diploscapter pachys TaxID=2018661 RepID=A0A2A2M1S3_9BILA|nr:hypothetical protein WR25_19870 [Diploscapter pachys]
MGKKGKIGKQRRDKYYKLAKETGYRSRAAFKLVQLNKRFGFLDSARAVVDLCAAPGGWMQVACQAMPVSSLVIGVDLAPIKPIRNAIALQGDITKEDTRQAIKRELQNWQADVVLNDGAPNVGLNWIHDAFNQNVLVLAALKLATQILRRGGTFVTKVFRSADYACLITVFEKLFKKVHVWKPAASRLESAEIFVVCERYDKPPKVDPALLDMKRVFASQDEDQAKSTKKTSAEALLIGKQKKAKAEGYETGQLALRQTVNASEFVGSQDYLELLGGANEIILDKDVYRNAPETTEEVREYLKDLKVCGPRELRILLRWRKSFKAKEEAERKAKQAEEKAEEKPLDPDELEDKELAEIDELIAKAAEEEKAALKKKKKRMLKAKALLLKRKQLKMIIEGDKPDPVEDIELFSLRRIRRARELAEINKDKVDAPDYSLIDEEEDDEGLGDGDWETRQKDGNESGNQSKVRTKTMKMN